jgi:hypothetical protein
MYVETIRYDFPDEVVTILEYSSVQQSAQALHRHRCGSWLLTQKKKKLAGAHCQNERESINQILNETPLGYRLVGVIGL